MTHLRTMIYIDTAENLRALLDELNAAGAHDRISGIDDDGDPFLAFLSGVYADSAGAYICNPCDPEIDPPDDRTRCAECGCMDPFGLSELAYPVVVIR